MIEAIGNIWDYRPTKDAVIVVPTNVGWKKNGENVMGAGIAKQAAVMFPDLPLWYGTYCEQYREKAGVTFYWQDTDKAVPSLALVPTKALDEEKPWLSWQQESTMARVEQSLCEIHYLVEQSNMKITIILPLLGCGNGGLDEKEVYPMMKVYLPEDNYILVREKRK